jgi:hemolysin activation/secretion protein
MTKIIVRLLFFIILIDFTIVNSITAGNQLSRQAKLKVSRINLKGNITFSTEELSALTAPCENREITIQELEELRKKITHYYTDRGYINSGVIIQDQDVADGVINFIIIEGGITATEVTGNDWLHKRYILSRLESAIKQEGKAFNINLLEKRLKLLKQDKLIENINAVISPGLKFGEANLNLEIDEARPYQISLKYNNHGSPGIGSYRGEIALAHYNLTGCLGDSLELNYKETEGFDDYSVNYTIPLTRFDTTLGFNYSFDPLRHYPGIQLFQIRIYSSFLSF